MLDRAVVEKKPEVWLSECYPGMKILDADGWRNPIGKPWTMPITREEFEQRLAYCTVEMTQRRALVALSEDRQWLVVLEPDIEGHPEATSAFGVWKRDIRAGWVLQAAIIDTGQDAHDVLNEFLDDEFLAGRQG